MGQALGDGELTVAHAYRCAGESKSDLLINSRFFLFSSTSCT